MIDFITAFVPGRQGLIERDARDWAEDLKTLGDDYFFSLNRHLFLATKESAPADVRRLAAGVTS